MKKAVTYLFVIITSLLMLILIPSTQPPAPMPWQITIMPDGNPKIFGIHLGVTRYRDAQILLKEYGETAIFIQQNKAPTVEVFFDSVHLGGLSAKIVLSLIVPEAHINAMTSRALKARLQPSGAYRYTLNKTDNTDLADASIATLTYIPSITLEADMIKRRFGEPNHIESHGDDDNKQTVWHYPALGLGVYFAEQEKTMLHYQRRN